MIYVCTWPGRSEGIYHVSSGEALDAKLHVLTMLEPIPLLTKCGYQSHADDSGSNWEPQTRGVGLRHRVEASCSEVVPMSKHES